MARGYITDKTKIDKTVWTQSFFAQLSSEISNFVGIHKLMWKVKGTAYTPGTLIMCSRKMRTWLLDNEEFASYYAKQPNQDAKLKCLRKAVTDPTTLDGK